MTKQQYIKHFIKGWKETSDLFNWDYDKRVARKYAYKASKEFVTFTRIGRSPNELPF